MCDQPRETVCLYVFPADQCPSDVWMRQAARHYGRARGQAWAEGDLRICRTPRGKPYFPDLPELYVSVTHSGSYCIVALAPCTIGIDLQTHQRFHNESAPEANQRYLRLSKRFFHPEEHAYVEQDPVERFFTVWCAKESYVKYTGTGLDDSLWTYSVLPNTMEEFPRWMAQNVHFSEIRLWEGYSFCICAERKMEHRVYSFLENATK